MTLSVIRFSALPMPYYINSGYSLAGPGRRHPERYAIGEFDLIVVKQGGLYIGEEGRHYEVSEGHALILRPDLHHYPIEGSKETTASFWLHFQTEGSWTCLEEDIAEPIAARRETSDEGRGSASTNAFRKKDFDIRLPQFTRLLRPGKVYELLRQLNAMESESHLDAIRWRQQRLFQNVLAELSDSLDAQQPKPGENVADLAASHLRLHYREALTAQDLGRALSFHPVYIARCMRRQFGCAPMEYLLRYRLEQAKRLLLQTDLPVGAVSREVGFEQPAYFASCFRKREGLTPRDYRLSFRKRPASSIWEADVNEVY